MDVFEAIQRGAFDELSLSDDLAPFAPAMALASLDAGPASNWCATVVCPSPQQRVAPWRLPSLKRAVLAFARVLCSSGVLRRGL
jgi:hypothetical protein